MTVTGAGVAAPVTTAAPASVDRGRRRALGIVLAIAIVAPPIVAIVALAGRTWHPVDDFAIIDLRVRDVFTTHPSLTGLFSRPGWDHPGPALFWLIAPVSGLFGQAAWATRVGGAVVDAAAMGWLAWISWRAGLRTMLTAAAVVGMTYLAIEAYVIRQPWNLHVPLVALPLTLFLALLVATGRTRHLIGLAIVATLVVQTHVGFAVPVMTAVVVALVYVTLDARRAGRLPDRWRSTLAWSALALVVLWAPPIVEAIANWPGNLGKIVAYFAAGNYQHVGLSEATGIMAGEFRFLPPWLGGTTSVGVFTGFATTSSRLWLLVPAVVLAAGGLAAWRTGRSDDRRMVALATALLVVGVVAISRADEPRAYTFEWRVVVAAFVVVAAVRAVAAWASTARGVTVVAAGLAIAVAAWGAIDLSVRIVTAGTGPLEARAPTLAAMLPTIRSEPAGRSILVRPSGSSLRSLYDGVINELDRAGVHARVDAPLGRVFGGHRVARAGDADEIWYVTEEGSTVPALLAQPGARLVASTSPLTRVENAELDRLQTKLRADFLAAGRSHLADYLDQPLFGVIVRNVPGLDKAAAIRVSELNQRVARHGGCRCAIVAVPAH